MSVRILTNHPGRAASDSWRDHATYVHAQEGDLWSTFLVALRLYMKRLDYDCVVLGAGRSDLWFALLQTILPFRRKPTMMIDCLWYERQNRFVQLAKKLMMQIADRSVDKYCVWASREIKAYARAFELPEEKFVFVPYHTTLEGRTVETRDDGYLFAGGDSGRDYETLIRAVTGLPITLHVASMRPESLQRLTTAPNIVFRRYSPDEFLQMMACCTINIVPLTGGLLHSSGQQTFLNSMWMGKPTIVADPAGACDYIEDGTDGILVEPGVPEALRESILRLLSNPGLAQEMGQRAQRKVRAGYSTEDHLRRIVGLAAELDAQTSRLSAERPQGVG